MRVKGDISGLDKLSDEVVDAYIERFVKAGEAGVKAAIERGNYQNRTGNLRSSIGYVIGLDGEVIKEGGFHRIQGRGENMQKVDFMTKDGKAVSFWAKGTFGDGSEGSRKGLEFARNYIAGTKGYSFVLVAGMEYASYVSSRGYDVMDSLITTTWNLIR